MTDVAEQREVLRFDEFYRKQQILPNEEEFSRFFDILEKPLVTTFRIVKGSAYSNYLLCVVSEFMKRHPDVLTRLDWMRPAEAFQLNVDRTTLRKSSELKDFHRFLVTQSEAGMIFRQEAVSMVPALFLDVNADSVLLDMAAAPGSKTSQLLEAMHNAAGPGTVPKGIVVANDACSTRGHMLIHHLRHLDSPALLVTNHYAQMMPNVFVSAGSLPSDERVITNAKWNPNLVVPFTQQHEQPPAKRPPGLFFTGPNQNPNLPELGPVQKLQYDGVLCDVPCSGDGTWRKSKAIAQNWTPTRGLAMHRIQVNILRRGLLLLREGGSLVYSTCSFNPLENEAVVHSALETFGDAIELLDQRERLGGLISAEGLTNWKVFAGGEWLETLQDVGRIRNRRKLTAVVPSMFPQFSCPPDVPNRRELLKRCMRFFPHHNDSGGFFVAVFRKISSLRPASLRLNERKFRSIGQIDEQDKAEEEYVEDIPEEYRPHCEPAAIDSTIPATGHVPELEDEGKEEFVPQLSWCTDFISVASPLVPLDRQMFFKVVGEPYGISCLPEEQMLFKFCKLQQSQKVWFCTTAVSCVINGGFRTPWKVQFAGCVCLEGRSSVHFRMRGCGYKWLVQPNIRSVPTSMCPRITTVTGDLMLLLMEKELVKFQEMPSDLERCLMALEKRAPCILVTRINDMEIGIPGWCGTTQAQILIDSESRQALCCLLSAEREKPL